MNDRRSSEKKDEIVRLRKVREDMNLSQEQFANILGISESTVKKIESYDRRLTVANLHRINERLGVSSDYILFGERPSRENTWKILLNSSETDKIYLFMRLIQYFTENRPELYPVYDGAPSGMEDFVRLITEGDKSEKLGEET